MITPLPLPIRRPSRPGRKRKLVALTTIGLAGLIAGLLAGCGTGNSPQINAAAISAAAKDFSAVAGNWKFATGTGSKVSAFSGALSVSGTTVSGTLHPLAAPCATSSESFQVAGAIDTAGVLSLTSSNFSDGKLAIVGALAADQHSLTEPTVTLTGGACAVSSLRQAGLAPRDAAVSTAQQFQPLTGSYNGIFTDNSGATLTVAATLSQPTAPDTNGVYHLTGYATFPNTPCLTTPVITGSTVTGDSIQATYTDAQTGNTVAASGTFSTDAQTLTITNWILSGCGDDAGTGLLTRQAN